MANGLHGTYKKGQAIQIQSTIKRGMADEQIYYNTNIKTINDQLVHGFALLEQVQLPEGIVNLPAKTLIKAIILEFLKDERVLKLLFPGELLTVSNPVSIRIKDIEK